MTRCPWAEAHPLLTAYHDEEWGVPGWSRQRLFEFLVLEGTQAGLSWLSVLKRRDAYRQAFHGFDPEIVSQWNAGDVERLLANPALIRNRSKLKSVITNARAFLAVEEQFGGFDRYLWHMVGDGILCRHYTRAEHVPGYDSTAEVLSRDLRGRGFKFVGPTICYSYLQAIGMVMDHLTSCFRYPELVPD